MSTGINERFSGHESFICRYGWLPKTFKAIATNPQLFRNEELAMTVLGIGRNMVKSIQFWAEASGVIANDGAGGHHAGPVGKLLFGNAQWDPYLESVESLWLIHWQLGTHASLAAWNEVFGEGLVRFDRQKLVAALAKRGASTARQLASSTLEQHASIFVQSYFQAERGLDDTSWCPLQDLSLIKATKAEDGKTIYNADMAAPVGLSLRVFGMALADYITRQGKNSTSADFSQVLKGDYSPGVVFRLDEYQLRQFVENVATGAFSEAIRFVDTADTQSVVLSPEKLDPQYKLWAQEEERYEHA